MKTIWKYELPQKENFELDMPFGAKILTVHEQKEVPYIWVLCNPENTVETRGFSIQPTGIQFDNKPLGYIGTYFLYEESLVFHLFEKEI